MGHLKHLTRAGWLLLGIPQPESVAEHTFRVGIVGIALAAQEGADIGRTAALCLLHDSPESRIGDVPSVGRAYVSTASPEAVAAHQTSGMPPALAEVFQGLVAEYEAAETIESQVAHDADKLETLLQAVEYQAQGHDTAGWRDSSTAALRTSSAKELARAISSSDPHEWWSAFAASYRECAQPRADPSRASATDTVIGPDSRRQAAYPTAPGIPAAALPASASPPRLRVITLARFGADLRTHRVEYRAVACRELSLIYVIECDTVHWVVNRGGQRCRDQSARTD
jgi:5'-deoxynucleotidase YfbR-like HD superfamily hydrolase